MSSSHFSRPIPPPPPSSRIMIPSPRCGNCFPTEQSYKAIHFHAWAFVYMAIAYDHNRHQLGKYIKSLIDRLASGAIELYEAVLLAWQVKGECDSMLAMIMEKDRYMDLQSYIGYGIYLPMISLAAHRNRNRNRNRNRKGKEEEEEKEKEKEKEKLHNRSGKRTRTRTRTQKNESFSQPKKCKTTTTTKTKTKTN